MRTKLTWIIMFAYVLTSGGCAHVANVPPPADSADAVGWEAYYVDQFKALQDDVPAPDEDASSEQRIAYEDAKTSFEHSSRMGLLLGLGVLLLGVISLALTLGQVSQL